MEGSRPGASSQLRSSSAGGLTARESIAASLELFQCCHPADDATIAWTDLEAALRQHLGNREADISRVLSLVAGGRGRPLAAPEGRLDFLSFWQGTDQFFSQDGGQTTGKLAAKPPRSGADMIWGMRRFRDGVLEISRQQKTPEVISSQALLSLLREIQSSSEDPRYWDEVMQAVPDEGGFGLSLLEVAEAVCQWLGDYLQNDDEDTEDASAASPPSRGGRSASPRFNLQAGNGDSPEAPPGQLRRRSRQEHPKSEGRFSLALSEAGGLTTSEIHRAQELLEVVDRVVSTSDDRAAQRAVERLQSSLEALGQLLKQKDRELVEMQRNYAGLVASKGQLEEELQQTHEFTEDIRETQRKLEEQRRRGDALEAELAELREHSAHQGAELQRLRDRGQEADQEKADQQRKDWHWRDKCDRLEQVANTAEGRAEWLKTELDRKESECKRLRRSLRALKAASRSFAGCAAEAEECAHELQRLGVAPSEELPKAAASQLTARRHTATGGSNAWAAPSDHLTQQLHLQQAQLQGLRATRDELLEVKETEAAEASGDEDADPRTIQAQRRCHFLTKQLKALLHHTQEVEQLLDTLRDGQLGSSPSPDVRRRLSIQKVQEEGTQVFNELSERLYTLEVQKADADNELRRLQARAVEQDGQLKTLLRRRDELLAEIASLRERHRDSGIAVSTEEGVALTGSGGGAASQGSGPGSAKFQIQVRKLGSVATGERSATSDTRSMISGSPAAAAGSDTSGFLVSPAVATPSSALMSSPKSLMLFAGVQKIVAGHKVLAQLEDLREPKTSKEKEHDAAPSAKTRDREAAKGHEDRKDQHRSSRRHHSSGTKERRREDREKPPKEETCEMQ